MRILLFFKNLRRGLASLVLAVLCCSWMFAGCQTSEQSENRGIIRIGLVADPQGADKDTYGKRTYRDSLRKMKDFVDAMLAWDPDFIVVLGDLIDVYSEDYLKAMDSEYARIPAARRHYVLGNHDRPHELFIGGLSAFIAPNYSFELKGVTFIILDGNWDKGGKSHNPPWNDSYVPDAELSWLEETLKNCAGKAVVFMHQRLDGDPERQRNEGVLQNAPAVRTVLEQSQKVIAVFQGHDHRCGAKNIINGIPYYTIWAMVEDSYPKTSYAYAYINVSTGTVSLYGKGNQRSYANEKPPSDVPVGTATQP